MIGRSQAVYTGLSRPTPAIEKSPDPVYPLMTPLTP